MDKLVFPNHAEMAAHRECKNPDHFKKFVANVVANSGGGVVLYKASRPYNEGIASPHIMCCFKEQRIEARVLKRGKRFAVCVGPNEKEFKVEQNEGTRQGQIVQVMHYGTLPNGGLRRPRLIN